MSAHKSHAMHGNSLKAYRELLASLGPRKAEVLNAVLALGAATDREIAKHLKHPDRSSVQPRVSDLVKAQILVEAGHTQCPVSGKQVRRVTVAALQKVAA